MAQLIVEAGAEETYAAPGNRDYLDLQVSVTSADGSPTIGLSAENFAIHVELALPGGQLGVTVTRFGTSRPGVYTIFLEPPSNTTWGQGGYIFSVAVKKGKDNGQTLTQAVLD
jgi:hypothetical protein